MVGTPMPIQARNASRAANTHNTAQVYTVNDSNVAAMTASARAIGSTNDSKAVVIAVTA
jgi:hypothetical protein